jgi:hypothetical protein
MNFIKTKTQPNRQKVIRVYKLGTIVDVVRVPSVKVKGKIVKNTELTFMLHNHELFVLISVDTPKNMVKILAGYELNPIAFLSNKKATKRERETINKLLLAITK